jgi:multiple sugar transport system substrate-binding protein
MSAMQMSRRDLLRYAAAGSAVVVLSACAPKAATPTTAPAVQPTEAKAPEPKPAAGKVTITQWYHEYGEAGCQEAVYRIADEYNKQQDRVTVEVTWTPGDYAAKLNSALAAGTGPDVYETQLSIDKVRNNYCVPLDDLFTPEIQADFDQKDLTLLTVEGHIYAVRMIIDTGLIYYRKSVLDAAGVGIPQNYDQLFEAAAKLTSARQKGLFVGNDGGGILQDQMAYAAGVTFIDPATLELQFNTPVLAEAWTKARELNQSGNLLIGSPTDWWDPAAFVQGLCAMCWGGLWMMPEVVRQIGDDFVVTQWLPVSVDGGSPRCSTFWGGWQEFVNGQSKNIPEAKELVRWQWIENTAWQNEWATAYGFHVPSRKSAAEANKAFEGGNAKIAKDGLYTCGWANGPMWSSAMGTAVSDAYWRVVRDGMDPKAEIEKAYEVCRAELERQLAG